ncbi:unnamed protein product [Angiostrongylus costaricensis]|uniref:Uncharacterized protein n=1 Tax=Angiostrongylus costaricensis TaxID=334426 RepID=A0A0R3PCG5_ANGCS|nr:unnamed protein product [Angiostrongylus costaricensis]
MGNTYYSGRGRGCNPVGAILGRLHCQDDCETQHDDDSDRHRPWEGDRANRRRVVTCGAEDTPASAESCRCTAGRPVDDGRDLPTPYVMKNARYQVKYRTVLSQATS